MRGERVEALAEMRACREGEGRGGAWMRLLIQAM